MLERDAKIAQRVSTGSGRKGDVCFCFYIQYLLEVWQRSHSGDRKHALHVPLGPSLPMETTVSLLPPPFMGVQVSFKFYSHCPLCGLGALSCTHSQVTSPLCVSCVSTSTFGPTSALSSIPSYSPCAHMNVPSSHVVVSSSST